jgi:hypothetical protein
MTLISFEEVEQLATIEELADMLGLKNKRYNGNQIRCSVPFTAASINLIVLSTRWLSPPSSFTDEVAELGITEEDAVRLQIGFTRGRVYLPVRNDDGSISGFIGYVDGQLKMPPQWIGTNVVKLKRA